MERHIFPSIVKIFLRLRWFHIALIALEHAPKNVYQQVYVEIISSPNTPNRIKSNAKDILVKRMNTQLALQTQKDIVEIKKLMEQGEFLSAYKKITTSKDSINENSETEKADFSFGISEIETEWKHAVVRILSSSEGASALDDIFQVENVNLIKELVQLAREQETSIEKLVNVLSYCQEKTWLREQDFYLDLKSAVVDKIKCEIDDKLRDFGCDEARGIKDRYSDFLQADLLQEISKQITEVENSVPAQIDRLCNSAKEFAQNQDFNNAWVEYKKAVNLHGGEEIDSVKSFIDSIQADFVKKCNQDAYEKALAEIKDKLEEESVEEAEQLISLAKGIPVDDDTELIGVSEAVSKLKSDLEFEKQFEGDYEIAIPLYKGARSFNIPKHEDKGEDADPFVDVSESRNWGVVAVFDGMGGAGARKYIHKDTQEAHTSAWWASRFVRDAVKDMIKSRRGSEPISFIESHLKQCIIDKLREEVSNFPAASLPLLSKMMRRLPTTLAMALYVIKDGEIQINCYWAGDSRVYLFDRERVYFLTKDDADAPDGDPFSPANMDLAMNNTICEDREFKISKSTITVPYSESSPIVLMAATDGCFGYFKNPIEFESMVRHSLINSDSINDWMPGIVDAIIENTQQDDFSMSIVEIGTRDFEKFKESFAGPLNSELYKEYFVWRDAVKSQQEALMDKIGAADEQISKIRSEIESREADRAHIEQVCTALKSHDMSLALQKACKDSIEKDAENKESLSEQTKVRNAIKEDLENLRIELEEKNNEWYAKYKESVVVVEPSSELN